MNADASKTEQASFRSMLLTCENEPRLSVKIIAYPRKFLTGSQLDFSSLISRPYRERSAQPMELLILTEFNEEPAPTPSSKNLVIGIPCSLQ